MFQNFQWVTHGFVLLQGPHRHSQLPPGLLRVSHRHFQQEEEVIYKEEVSLDILLCQESNSCCLLRVLSPSSRQGEWGDPIRGVVVFLRLFLTQCQSQTPLSLCHAPHLIHHQHQRKWQDSFQFPCHREVVLDKQTDSQTWRLEENETLKYFASSAKLKRLCFILCFSVSLFV